MTATGAVTITHLDQHAHGVGTTADGAVVAVRFALPGEQVVDGAVVASSPDRVAPPCAHFTHCGGCVAQHMSDPVYVAWKTGLVSSALARQKIDVVVSPLVRVPAESRRRATFAVAPRERDAAGSARVLGFHRSRSSEVIDVTGCRVVTPAIAAALSGLGRLVARLAKVDADTRIAVADLEGGLDVVVSGAAAPASVDARADLGERAAAARIARLSFGSDVYIERARVAVPTTTGPIAAPPGAFFQAVAAAEQAIVAAVLDAVPKRAKRIADLFSGLGTLSLPLAARGTVLAVDGERVALTALDAAARRIPGLKPVETLRRDLFREPLSRRELAGFDMVVLDPPRAGARAQCTELAASGVARIAMVSCDAGTFARDARALVDGGYRLKRVIPIDQFVWSAHVEMVGVFSRGSR